MEIEKTIRMNVLFSFYKKMLTSKQASYMSDYYENDYTLAEIADNHDVSRQAIYDSIKRTEATLNQYEEKLKLVEEFENRQEIIDKIQKYIKHHYPNDQELMLLVSKIIQDSNREEN